MKKSELVAGKHVVQLRNGDNYLVLENKPYGLILSKLDLWCDLDTHNENLTCQQDSNLDIIKVGLIDFGILEKLQDDNYIKWIWERKELKHNVGDCFKASFGRYWKIIGKENGYYQLAKINEYGDVMTEKYPKDLYTDENFKNDTPYTPIERPKFEVRDVIRCIKKDDEFKPGDLKRVLEIIDDEDFGTAFVIEEDEYGSKRWLTGKAHDKWGKVDINTLTVKELKDLGYEIKVVK